MTDDQTTIRTLKTRLASFTRERNWEPFHRPKDLGICLAIEAGEVLEHFRFRTDGEIDELLGDPERKREVAHELADCLWAVVRLADVCEVDLAEALDTKLELAALKYPIERAAGPPEKNTRLGDDPDAEKL